MLVELKIVCFIWDLECWSIGGFGPEEVGRGRDGKNTGFILHISSSWIIIWLPIENYLTRMSGNHRNVCVDGWWWWLRANSELGFSLDQANRYVCNTMMGIANLIKPVTLYTEFCRSMVSIGDTYHYTVLEQNRPFYNKKAKFAHNANTHCHVRTMAKPHNTVTLLGRCF